MTISGLESEVKYQRQIKDNLISKHSCAYRVQMILYLVYPAQGTYYRLPNPNFDTTSKKNSNTSLLHEIIALHKK